MKTLKLYKMYLDDFFVALNKPVETISSNDIKIYLYRTQQARGISNSSLDSRRAAIRSFFGWSADNEYLAKNPCKGVQPIKYERREREPLTSMELERVRSACWRIREKALVEFIYSSGCRVGEVEHCNIKDVDLEKREVLLFGKGSKHRIAYLSSRAVLMLKEYLESRDDDNEALFVSERAPYKRLSKPGIEKVIRDLGQRAGLERRLFPHLIRHTFATDCLARDMDITQIQKILGHTNVSTTLVYAKVNEAEIKTMHAKCIS